MKKNIRLPKRKILLLPIEHNYTLSSTKHNKVFKVSLRCSKTTIKRIQNHIAEYALSVNKDIFNLNKDLIEAKNKILLLEQTMAKDPPCLKWLNMPLRKYLKYRFLNWRWIMFGKSFRVDI